MKNYNLSNKEMYGTIKVNERNSAGQTEEQKSESLSRLISVERTVIKALKTHEVTKHISVWVTWGLDDNGELLRVIFLGTDADVARIVGVILTECRTLELIYESAFTSYNTRSVIFRKE